MVYFGWIVDISPPPPPSLGIGSWQTSSLDFASPAEANIDCPPSNHVIFVYTGIYKGTCWYHDLYWTLSLKRCQGCVKLIASKVNCFLNINELSEVQLCMSSNSWTWECPHTKDGADHVPLILLSSVVPSASPREADIDYPPSNHVVFVYSCMAMWSL